MRKKKKDETRPFLFQGMSNINISIFIRASKFCMFCSVHSDFLFGVLFDVLCDVIFSTPKIKDTIREPG